VCVHDGRSDLRDYWRSGVGLVTERCGPGPAGCGSAVLTRPAGVDEISPLGVAQHGLQGAGRWRGRTAPSGCPSRTSPAVVWSASTCVRTNEMSAGWFSTSRWTGCTSTLMSGNTGAATTKPAEAHADSRSPYATALTGCRCRTRPPDRALAVGGIPDRRRQVAARYLVARLVGRRVGDAAGVGQARVRVATGCVPTAAAVVDGPTDEDAVGPSELQPPSRRRPGRASVRPGRPRRSRALSPRRRGSAAASCGPR
jgi:hypothetical protein